MTQVRGEYWYGIMRRDLCSLDNTRLLASFRKLVVTRNYRRISQEQHGLKKSEDVARKKIEIAYIDRFIWFYVDMRISEHLFCNYLTLQASSHDKHRAEYYPPHLHFCSPISDLASFCSKRSLLSPVTMKLTRAKIVLGFAREHQYRRVKNLRIAPPKCSW